MHKFLTVRTSVVDRVPFVLHAKRNCINNCCNF